MSDKDFQSYLNGVKATDAARSASQVTLTVPKPDAMAEGLELGQELGVPASVAVGSLDLYRAHADQKRATEAMRGAPKTAVWLANPVNGSLAKDDLDNLTWFERGARVVSASAPVEAVADTQFGRGLRTGGTGAKQMGVAAATIPLAGMTQSFFNELGAFDRVKDMPRDTGRALVAETLGLDPLGRTAFMAHSFLIGDDAQREKLTRRALGAITSNKEAMTFLLSTIDDYTKDMEESQGRVPNFTDADEIGDFLDWAAFNTGQMIPYFAAVAASGLLGGAPGVGAAGYALGIGDIQAELIGEGVAPEDAAPYALAGGVPYAALEYLGPAASLTRGVSKKVIAEVAEGYFKRLGKEIPRQMVEEFINEAGQEIVKDFTVAGATDDAIVLNDETLLRWFNSGMAGLIGGGSMATVSATATGRVEKRAGQAAAAGGTAAELMAIEEKAGESKVKARSVDKFQEGLEAQGDGVIYVPADDMREYFQSKDEAWDVEAVSEYGLNPETFEEQADGGQDVAISRAAFAARIAGTDDAVWFVENSVSDPDEMSASDAAAFNEEVGDIRAEAMEADDKDRREELDARADDVQIRDEVYSQLRAAGQSPAVAGDQAAVHASYWRTLGETVGERALDLAREFGMRVQGPQTVGVRPRGALDVQLNTLRSKGVPKPTGESILDFVASLGGVRDTGGDIEGMDPPKGLIGETRAQGEDRESQPGLDGPAVAAGVGLDELWRQAIEAGYFPEYAGGANIQPDGTVVDEAAIMLDALGAALSGAPRYLPGEGPDVGMQELADDISELGLDISEMTNDELVPLLEGGRDKGLRQEPGGATSEGQQIFQQADDVAKILEESGHTVEVTKHPTSWGNSAYITYSRPVNGGRIERGIRLSDHDVGDRRARTDLHQTVIYNGGPASDIAEVHAITDSAVEAVERDLAAGKKTAEAKAATEAAAEAERKAKFTKEEAFNAEMVDARRRFIAEEHPGFSELTATKQRPIIKAFNKAYRDANGAVDVLYQGGFTQGELETDSPLGAIQFPIGGLDTGTTVISLFNNANPSTFLHESAHYFLEVSLAVADDPRATARLKDDAATIREWLGNDGGDLTTEQHEKWARGAELYFMEGKAPSLDLAQAFSRFKAWLTHVYKSTFGLNAKINPEIRDVMDRMIATDAEIAEARAAQEMGPLFETAPVGMSKTAWATYQRMGERGTEVAEGRLLSKTMAAVRREKEAWYKAEKKAVGEEVEDLIDKMPVFRLTELLGNKVWFGSENEIPDMRIDRQALVDMFGVGVLAEISQKKVGGGRAIYGPNGSHPAEVADYFGFAGPVQMVEALQNAGKRVDAVKAETDRRMMERHGDPLHDGTIEEEATDAIHNEQQAAANVSEARYMGKRLGRSTARMKTKIYRHRARMMIGRMTVRDASRSSTFLAAERKAARAAEEAFAKVARSGRASDLATALQAKEQQILNGFMFNESRKVDTKVKKGREWARRFGKVSVRKKIRGNPGSGFRPLDQIDDILSGYDFRVLSRKKIENSIGLKAFMDDMVAQGRENELNIDPRVVSDANRQHYTKISVDDFDGVISTLANLDHIGRSWGKLIDKRGTRDFKAVKAELGKTLRANFKERPMGIDQTTGEKVRDATMGYLDVGLNADSILRHLDGYKEFGAFFKNIKMGVDSAAVEAHDMRVQGAKDMEELFSPYTRKERRAAAKSRHVKGTGRAFSKWHAISYALNIGNADNRRRVLDRANHEASRVTGAELEAILDTLDERDWKFVRDTWALIEGYWPMIVEREKRISGQVPKKVEPILVQTKYGSFMGGYYPIKYDSRRNAISNEDAATELAAEFSGGRIGKAATARGHLETRKSSGGRTLAIGIDVLPQHLNRVTYDLAMSEAVTNAWKLIKSTDLRAEFIKIGRLPDLEALELWIRDVASGPMAGQDFSNKGARYLKNTFTMSKLAFNVATMSIQWTGLGQSAVQIGKANMAYGLSAYLRAPRKWAADITAKSKIMADRAAIFDRDFYDMMGDVTSDGPLQSGVNRAREIIGRAGFYGIQKTQFWQVDLPTWIGAYHSGLKQFSQDEEKAIKYADKMVNRSQGSAFVTDRTAFQRGTLSLNTRQSNIVKLFTTLGSYMFDKFNVAYERGQRGVREMKGAETLAGRAAIAANMAVDMLLLYTLEAVAYAWVHGDLPWQDDEEDDAASVAAWLAKETALSFVSGLPWMKDVAGPLEGYGGGGAYGSITETPGRLLRQIMQGDADRALYNAAGSFIGLASGLPTTQSMRVINGLIDTSKGDDVSPIEFIMGR